MPPTELDAVLSLLGWSDRELAVRLGCDRSLPGKWRKGRAKMRPVDAEWLRACAAALAALPPPDRPERAGRENTPRTP